MNDKRKIIAIFIIVAIVAALAAVATFSKKRGSRFIADDRNSHRG